MVVPGNSRGNTQFKGTVDEIERELTKLETEDGGITNDSACACVNSKRQTVQARELEHKRFKSTSIEYKLSVLKESRTTSLCLLKTNTKGDGTVS